MDQVELDPVARLRLVASSIAGRMLDVRAGATGEPAWTDGRTIYVDPDAPLIQAIAVQASLIAAGSLAPDVVRRLSGRPALTRRYLAVEGARALAANEDRLPPVALSLLAPRIGSTVMTAAGSLAVAQSGVGDLEPPAVFGTVRPRAVLSAYDESERASAATVNPVSSRASRAQADDVDGVDDDRALDFLTDPGGGGGALGRLLQRLMKYGRRAGPGALGADVPPRGHRVDGRPRGGVRGRGSATQSEAGAAAAQGAGWVYPEWDVRRQAYRHDWCTVTEEDPPHEGRAVSADRDRSLRRPLSRLGLGLEVVHRRPQGEDVDIDAAVEARVQAAAGGEPTDAVYLESLRRRHDLAVLVMLDVSGSANEPSVASGTVHDQQLAGASALVRALHALGNRVALYGFYSQGRSAVRVVRVKRFNEMLTLRVLRRLGNLEPGGYTRLGAAIRHGTDVLEQQGGGSRRLLIVLSDGFAYDHGYAGRYGEADARRALAEARQRGVGCLCLSIGASTDLAELRRVFGSAAHATVRRTDELDHVVGPLFRDALMAAEQRRSA